MNDDIDIEMSALRDAVDSLIDKNEELEELNEQLIEKNKKLVDFINDLRLRRASQEIVLTSKSITDIALDHGFDNIGYFFKLFKLKFGQTPLSYRKNKGGQDFEEEDDTY